MAIANPDKVKQWLDLGDARHGRSSVTRFMAWRAAEDERLTTKAAVTAVALPTS